MNSPIIAVSDRVIDKLYIKKLNIGNIIKLIRSPKNDNDFWCNEDGEIIITERVDYYGENTDNSSEYLKEQSLGNSVLIIETELNSRRDISSIILGKMVGVKKQYGLVTNFELSEDTIKIDNLGKFKGPIISYIGSRVIFFIVIDDPREFNRLYDLFVDEKTCIIQDIIQIS